MLCVCFRYTHVCVIPFHRRSQEMGLFHLPLKLILTLIQLILLICAFNLLAHFILESILKLSLS